VIERIEFAEIPASLVDAKAARLANAVCRLVSLELGLRGVELCWVAPVWDLAYEPVREDRRWAESNSAGWVREGYPGRIYIVAGKSFARTVETVAHELRHLWQAERHGDWDSWWRDCRSPADRADQEADATAFGRQVARDLGW
jgi:hypothetical protein